MDILTKMTLKNINISNAKEALNMLRAYKSDHILLLPKIEQLLKKDKQYTQVVLWALTETNGPISFNLLNKLCYIMATVKKSSHQKSSDTLQGHLSDREKT